jgi:hypothetical protein
LPAWQSAQANLHMDVVKAPVCNLSHRRLGLQLKIRKERRLNYLLDAVIRGA